MIGVTDFYKNVFLSLLGWGVVALCLLLLATDAASFLFHFYAFPALILIFFVFAYCCIGFYINRGFMLGAYFIIYYFSFLIVSCFFVESGALMREIDKFGFPNGSLVLVVVFFIFAVEFGRFGYLFGSKVGGLVCPKIRGKWEQYFVYVTIFVSVFASLYLVFKYSSPFFKSMERVDFVTLYAPPWFGPIKSLVVQSFFLVAIVALSRQTTAYVKRWAWLALVFYCLFAVLVFGEKFSLLNSFAMMFFLVFSSRNYRFSFRGMALFLIAAAVVVCLVVYVYISNGRGVMFIFDRIALQAQVVWMYMNFSEARGAYRASCLLGCDEWTSGADVITSIILPEYLYKFYLDTGSILSGFSPAIYLFFLGPIFGVGLFCFVSFLLGFLQGCMAVQIREGGIIFPFFIFKLYIALLLFLYMNDLGLFDNYLVMLALFFVILMSMLSLVNRAFVRTVSG